jgi:hypothetical protein
MENTMNPDTSWPDEEWDVFRDWIKQLLQNSPKVTVTFTKADGTERVMNCTLDPDVLPKQEITEGKEPRKVNPEVLPVYDIEAKGWRSFRVKSVSEVSFSVLDDEQKNRTS